MIPQLLGRNGRLLMPILALLLINLPATEAKLEFPEGSMGNFALVGLIFTSISFGFGLKHQVIYGFRVLFGRRLILSDVEGHERLRISREWYHCANWISSKPTPAPSQALVEAAAARVLDVERQLFEEMPPPPRALPVRLYKSLLRTAKSFFPPATSGDGSTNENSRRNDGEAPGPLMPPKLQSRPAQRGKSATSPQELGILHFQAFVFVPRQSRALRLVRKLAGTPPAPPKDGSKIGFLYSSYTPRMIHQSKISTRKRLFSNLLRAMESPRTAPNSTISRRNNGKAPEPRIPPQLQISTEPVCQLKKLTHGHKSATTSKDGSKVGFLYTSYTPKTVPRLRSTHRWSKFEKAKCIFLESEPVSRLFRAIENGLTPATSVDKLTKRNTRRNEGRAPEDGQVPPGIFEIVRRDKHRHRSTTTTKYGRKATHRSTKSGRRTKQSTHGSTKSGNRPRRSTHDSTKSVCRLRKSTHGHKSAITRKDGGSIGIHYAGYRPKAVPRLRSTREIFFSELFIRLLRAVEKASASPNSTKNRRNKGKAPEPCIPPKPQNPTTHTRKHRSLHATKPTHGQKSHSSAKPTRQHKKSTHRHKSHRSGNSAHQPNKSAQGQKSAHTPGDGGEVGIHYVGSTPTPPGQYTSTHQHRSTHRHRESTPTTKHTTTKDVGKARTHRHRETVTPSSKQATTEDFGKARIHRPKSSNHTAHKNPKSEQQDVITPPPKAHVAASSSLSSSKQVEIPSEPAISHPSLYAAPSSPLIKFASEIITPPRRAHKLIPTALIPALDLARTTISRKSVPSSSSSSVAAAAAAGSSSITTIPVHTIPRKAVPSASS